MSEPLVQTVAGLRPARALGVVDAHDHLFLRSPALAGQELEDPSRAAEEVRDGLASGLATIVEMTPIGLGRRPSRLRELAAATGAVVVAASGYHRDAHYPGGHWIHAADEATLEALVVADAERGMHDADWLGTDGGPEGVEAAAARGALDPARAGVVKAGASYQRIGRSEARRLAAGARAATRTGLPLLVHAEVGTCGHEILDAAEAAGLPASRVLLAHLDRNPDAELHAELAARGATLEYDTVGRIKYRPDSDLLELIESVAAAGHLERIVLGLDLGLREYFRSHDGGPGLGYLMRSFVPRLRRRLGDAAVERILVANPARAFALAPDGSVARAAAEAGR